MKTIRRFEDLEVWQKARELTNIVYRLTANAAFNNDLRLRNQMRDASVSIMANIAEGFSRNSDREFARFLFISKSSGAELQSHCYVALDQQYICAEAFSALYEEIDHTLRMLSNLIKYLNAS